MPKRIFYARSIEASLGSVYPHLQPASHEPCWQVDDVLCEAMCAEPYVVVPARVISVEAAVDDNDVTPPEGYVKLPNLKAGVHKRKSHVLVAKAPWQQHGRAWAALPGDELPPVRDVELAIVAGTGRPVEPAGYACVSCELNAKCGGDSPWLLVRSSPLAAAGGAAISLLGSVVDIGIVFSEANSSPSAGQTVLEANANAGIKDACPAHVTLRREALTALDVRALPSPSAVSCWADVQRAIGDDVHAVALAGGALALVYRVSVEQARALVGVRLAFADDDVPPGFCLASERLCGGAVALCYDARGVEAGSQRVVELALVPSGAAAFAPAENGGAWPAAERHTLAYSADGSEDAVLFVVCEGARREAQAYGDAGKAAGREALERLAASHAALAAELMGPAGADRLAALSASLASPTAAPIPGLLENCGNTCYMGALVFALLAPHRLFDATLLGAASSGEANVRVLAVLLAEAAAMLRRGERLPRDASERLRHALRVCGWEAVDHYLAGKADQQDSAELAALLFSLLAHAPLQLVRRVVHAGEADDADVRLESELLLQAPIAASAAACLVRDADPSWVGAGLRVPLALPALQQLLPAMLSDNTLDVPLTRLVAGVPTPQHDARLEYRLLLGGGASPVLVPLVLKRFNNAMQKVAVRTHVPLALDASGLTAGAEPAMLRLLAVVCHSGDKLSSGHYYCFARASATALLHEQSNASAPALAAEAPPFKYRLARVATGAGAGVPLECFALGSESGWLHALVPWVALTERCGARGDAATLALTVEAHWTDARGTTQLGSFAVELSPETALTGLPLPPAAAAAAAAVAHVHPADSWYHADDKNAAPTQLARLGEAERAALETDGYVLLYELLPLGGGADAQRLAQALGEQEARLAHATLAERARVAHAAVGGAVAAASECLGRAVAALHADLLATASLRVVAAASQAPAMSAVAQAAASATRAWDDVFGEALASLAIFRARVLGAAATCPSL